MDQADRIQGLRTRLYAHVPQIRPGASQLCQEPPSRFVVTGFHNCLVANYGSSSVRT
jgi:hypothetical protein